MDYGSPVTREVGNKLIAQIMGNKFKPKMKKSIIDKLQKIEDGKRDVYI